MHLWWVVLACAVDGATAILLAVAGVALMGVTGHGVLQAAARSEFAIGMLLGGLAWALFLAAALFLGHACWCWQRLRRLGPRHVPKAGEIILLLFAPLGAAVGAVAIALRLLN